MVKAHCDQAREELFDHVGKRQLGAMKCLLVVFREAELVLSNGQSILSSEGGQQGCGLTNLLLALPMEYVMW